MNEVTVRFRTLGLGGPRVWLRVVETPPGSANPGGPATDVRFANGSIFVSAGRAGNLPPELLGPKTPDGWTPVSAPCEVVIDDTGLHLEQEKTLVMSPPQAPPGEYRAEEVTRNFPIEQMVGVHGQDLTTPLVSRSSPSRWTGIAKTWRETPLPRKVLVFLLPLAIVVSIGAASHRGAHHAPAGQPQATASGSASARPTAEAPAPPAESTAAATPPSPPASAPAAIAQADAKNDPKKAQAGAKAAAPKKSQERLAADAVAAGSYAEAIALYDELAREHPESVAFREAARILRQKTGTR